MSFTEEWFGVPSQTRLAELATAAPDGTVIEIGSWEGRSTCALAKAVWPRTVHAVDTWAGSPGRLSEKLASQRDIYATFLANIEALTGGNVQPHRMGWREYLPSVEPPVAFAFIDAEHTYREVYDNIWALLPLMASGGVVCGDDQHHPQIQQALADCFDPRDVEVVATVWSWRKP